jgi:hypothetical protein
MLLQVIIKIFVTATQFQEDEEQKIYFSSDLF